MDDDEIYKCIRDNEADVLISYCGTRLSGIWHYMDPDHAVRNRQQEGRLLICKDCRKKVNEIMKGE